VFTLAKNNRNIFNTILRNKNIYQNTVNNLSNPNFSKYEAKNDLRKLKDSVTNQSHVDLIKGINNNYNFNNVKTYTSLDSLKKS